MTDISKKEDLKILLIVKDPSFSALLEKPLRDQGFNLCGTISPDIHIRDLDLLCPDLAILGPSLDKGSGLKCIRKLKIVNPLMPVLVPSDHGTVQEQNSMAYLEGVHYYSQSADVDEISKTIETALAHERNYRLRSDVPVLVGSSPQMSAIRQRIYKVSDKDITVLVTGETGTGKELIARYIHHFSHRSHGPLVKINCGTLPDELMESEVLGFQKGAFTDAHRTKMGRLETADGGTLFIDEIGDLSPSVQVKFLPVLEDKAFSRLGGDRDRPVDVRLIAATNSNLWEKAREGSFRKDLFYRLNVVHILAPPLRDRRGDIPLLVRYFLNKYCLALKKKVPEVPQRALDLFLGYHWPGNVRELENLIRRAIVLQNWDFVSEEVRPGNGHTPGLPSSTGGSDHLGHVHDVVLRYVKGEQEFSLKNVTRAYVSEAERLAISDALEKTEWNRQEVAESLGISYKTLCSRINEFGLKPEMRRKEQG